MSGLTEVRETVGLRPSFVANKLGITYSQFNRLENGISKLDKLKLEKLAELYNIDLNKITKIAEEAFEKKVNELIEREEALNKKLEAVNGITN